MTNPDIYRCLRDAVENRSVNVPDTVTDTTSGSFIAKRIIAAIWSKPEEKTTRDTLLLEYHKMRLEVINASKGLLEQRQSQPATAQSDEPSSSSPSLGGPSTQSVPGEEAYTRAARTLGVLDDEERQALRSQEDRQALQSERADQSSSDEDDDENNNNERTQTTAQGQPAVPGTNNKTLQQTDTPIRAGGATPSIPLTIPLFHPDHRTPRGRRSSAVFAPDRYVTRRARSLSRPRPAAHSRPIHASDHTPTAEAGSNVFDSRSPGEELDSDQVFLQLMRMMVDQNKVQHEIHREVQRQNNALIERLAQSASISPHDSRLAAGVYHDRHDSGDYDKQKETVRKARKAFSSHFASKLFSGRFGDDWNRHCDDFVQYCGEWDIPEHKYADYLRETVRGDALNYITGLRKSDPSMPWSRMSAQIADRYANVNRQKEVSDRLHSLRYADFDTPGEDPATTLERIIDYVDKHTPIALPSDQTDAAKARFLSNATRGQTWALHAEGRISSSATYERTAQALATSIRDLAEHEESRSLQRKNKKGANHRELLYKTLGRGNDTAIKEDEEPDDYVVERSGSEQFLTALETFFGSSRFGRDPRDLKRNNHNSGVNTTRQSGKYNTDKRQQNAANRVGCFNCGRTSCSVATCPKPRDANRIAENLSRWRRLRKIEREAKVNLSMVNQVCFCPSEALEVLSAATYLEKDDATNDTVTEEDPKEEFQAIQEELHASAMDHQASQKDDEKSFPWLDDPDDSASMHFIREQPVIQHRLPRDASVLSTSNTTAATVTGHRRCYDGEFAGACLDTGAQRSVCGLAQAESYARNHPGSLTLKPRSLRFRFGHHVIQSMGKVNIRIPQGNNSHLSLSIHVVNLDIPLIIGLDVLKSYHLLINYLANQLEFPSTGTTMPLVYKRGHIFLEWDHQSILFTKAELTRLHLHFMHPAADRLFQLIKRASTHSATHSVKQLIENITSACRTCQEFKSRPIRFRASIPPGQLVFNESISIDLLWLENKPALHVIDDHTGFRNAVFLRSKTADDIWSAFVSCWASTYVGFPSRIRSDQESGVSSSLFRDIATANGIQLEFAGVSSHSSMGRIEQAHAPLRRIFRILTESHSNLSPPLRPRYAVKA